MAYTNLTGKNFQKAHLALMEQKGKVAQVHDCSNETKVARVRGKVARVRDCSDETAVLEAFAVAVGIILGVAFLIGAASCGMARGAAWECGNYADAPVWND